MSWLASDLRMIVDIRTVLDLEHAAHLLSHNDVHTIKACCPNSDSVGEVNQI